MKKPPYEWVADVGSLALVLFVLLAYRYFPLRTPAWAFYLAAAVSVAVAVAVLTELWGFFRAYRAGTFFPMRNASLFLLLLTLGGLPVYVLYTWLSTGLPDASTLLLLPVLLTLVTRNLFRVQLSPISFRAKTGFRGPREIPLFQIAAVDITDQQIVVQPESGPAVRLLRVFFFPAHWQKLTTALAKLRA